MGKTLCKSARHLPPVCAKQERLHSIIASWLTLFTCAILSESACNDKRLMLRARVYVLAALAHLSAHWHHAYNAG